jgi:hypothetical protein
MRKALLVPLLLGIGCTQEPTAHGGEEAVAPAGCMAGGAGRFEADLRGALEADLAWSNAQMECDGDFRPDGQGLRVSIAGPLDGGRRVRFIFGIGLADAAGGPAVVLPTNLTVIVEGETLLYATRGEDRCAVERLDLGALQDGFERVDVRGYCIGPASDLAGETRVLVPTFSFTARVRAEAADAQ